MAALKVDGLENWTALGLIGNKVDLLSLESDEDFGEMPSEGAEDLRKVRTHTCTQRCSPPLTHPFLNRPRFFSFVSIFTSFFQFCKYFLQPVYLSVS